MNELFLVIPEQYCNNGFSVEVNNDQLFVYITIATRCVMLIESHYYKVNAFLLINFSIGETL